MGYKYMCECVINVQHKRIARIKRVCDATAAEQQMDCVDSAHTHTCRNTHTERKTVQVAMTIPHTHTHARRSAHGASHTHTHHMPLSNLFDMRSFAHARGLFALSNNTHYSSARYVPARLPHHSILQPIPICCVLLPPHRPLGQRRHRRW